MKVDEMVAPTDTASPPRTMCRQVLRATPGFSWTARLVLFVAVLILLGSAVQKAYRFTLPTDGWTFQTGDIGSTSQDEPAYQRNVLGKLSPLRYGDRLIGIERHPYEQLVQRALRLRAPSLPQWRTGHAVRYTVMRHGHKVTLAVPLYHWSLGEALGALLTDLSVLGGLPLAAIALYVFLHRPDEWAARALLLFGVSWPAAAISASTIDSGPPEVAVPLFVPIEVFFSNLIFPMVMLPSLLMVVLTCPRPRGWVRRHPLPFVIGLYGLSPVLLVLQGPTASVFWPLALAMAVASVVVMVVSFVTERDVAVRLQGRWAQAGLAGMMLGLALLIVNAFGTFGTLPGWVYALWLPLMLIVATVGFSAAILNDRLFDIELIVNRLLVYGALSGGVVLLYVLVTGYLAALLHVHSSAVPSLLVTAIVALAFQPAREWLQRQVNSIMFGERNMPYRVLTRLGDRFEGVLDPGEVLPTLVRTVADSLKLPYVELQVEGEELPANTAMVGVRTGNEMSFPLVHQGERVGYLVVCPRRGEPSISQSDRELLLHLAQQVGAAVHGVRLTLHLARLSADLQKSREHLVLAREEERSRLRRDLHDGLAPTLAGLSLQAGTVAELVARDPALAVILARKLEGSIRDSVGEVRRLVYDLRPPTLDDLGLLPAIRERATHFDGNGPWRRLQVRLDLPDDLPALPAAVEVAVFRIVQEALMNVERHASARCCSIYLAVRGDGPAHMTGELLLEIEDNGGGMPEQYTPGVGLRSMRERAEELGGTFQLHPRPGGGTCLAVRMPLTGR